MANFDQRGQNVQNQVNVAGNLNFGAAQDKSEFIAELRKLLAEVSKGAQAGLLADELAIDVESKIKKAIVQAEKPQPDKQSMLDNINGAKALIEGLASAAGLIGGFAQAAEVLKRIF